MALRSYDLTPSLAGQAEKFLRIRTASVELARPLETEDYVVQSMPSVSPTKWHLAHTTWFFERFILGPHRPGYTPWDPDFAFPFHSSYPAILPMPTPPPSRLTTPTACSPVAAVAPHHVHRLLEQLEGPRLFAPLTIEQAQRPQCPPLHFRQIDGPRAFKRAPQKRLRLIQPALGQAQVTEVEERLGEVDGVADCCVGEALLSADIADRHPPTIDSKSRSNSFAARVLKCRERCAGVECGADRIFGVTSTAAGCAKKRNHRVAAKPLYDTVIRAHRFTELREIDVQEGDEYLRREGFRETGERGDVGKQYAHLTRLAA